MCPGIWGLAFFKLIPDCQNSGVLGILIFYTFVRTA